MSDTKKPRRLGATPSGPRPVRRVAGQSARPTPATAEQEPAEVETTKPPKAPRAPRGGSTESGVLDNRRTTVVLSSVLAVAVVLLLALTVTWFAGEPDEGDVDRWEPTIGAGEFELPKEGELPVTVGSVEWASSVDEVAKAVTKIFTFSAKTIDTHVDDVSALMTDDFLEGEYQETFAATAGKVKANNAEYQMTAVGQSVISASSDRVTALLFANQFVAKGTGANASSEVNPIRLIVSAIRVDNAWKIDEIKAG